MKIFNWFGYQTILLKRSDNGIMPLADERIIDTASEAPL